MPIKPENRARYPKDWPAISAQARERARWRCEKCGVRNGALGGRTRDGAWHAALPLGERSLRLEWPKPGTLAWCSGHDSQLRIVRIVLTVAHLDHEPENCDPSNLRAWCQRCHLRYDHAHHMANARATRQARKAAGDLFA